MLRRCEIVLGFAVATTIWALVFVWQSSLLPHYQTTEPSTSQSTNNADNIASPKTAEKQLDEKFAELEAAVQRTFKPDAIDRKHGNPEAMRERITDEANDLLEDWRGQDSETKPKGTIERLCAEYCDLETALNGCDRSTPGSTHLRF
jgi:inactivated superfamily I helicase